LFGAALRRVGMLPQQPIQQRARIHEGSLKAEVQRLKFNWRLK
jgi:hypothetical protein